MVHLLNRNNRPHPYNNYNNKVQNDNKNVRTQSKRSKWEGFKWGLYNLLISLKEKPTGERRLYGPNNKLKFQYSECSGRRKAVCIVRIVIYNNRNDNNTSHRE